MKFNHLPKIQLQLKSSTTSTGRLYTTPTGKIYPSITTILGSKEKPYLHAWRESLGQQAAAKETKRCAERGTDVHAIIERYLNNEEVLRPKNTLTAKIFSQTKMALNHINNIRVLEAALYNDELKIAGRVDCVAEYDKVLSVIDFKTSTNNKTPNMIEDYKLQCTAYAIMYGLLYNEAVENIVIIMGIEKGLCPFVFQDKIDNYVGPLLERINTYYKKRTEDGN